MLPHLMMLVGLILSFFWGASPLFTVFGVSLLLYGIVLYRQVYNRGNLLYWKWREVDQSWRIALDKRLTILDRMANTIEKFSVFEGNLLRNLSADRSAAMFLSQSFPTIETMSATRELYYQIQVIETEINNIRQNTAVWNRELQQIGTDMWFNMCLPSYVKAILVPELIQPEGNLNPAPDPGLQDINKRDW
jgi:hypothetical protein